VGDPQDAQNDVLFGSVSRARADAITLVEYLAPRGMADFNPVLTWSPTKIVKDPTAAQSLFAYLKTLSEAASPATVEGIRLAAIMDGGAAASEAEGQLLHLALRLKGFQRWFRLGWIALAGALALAVIYAGLGEKAIGDALAIQRDMTDLVADWGKKAVRLRSPADVIHECATPFATKNSQVVEDPELSSLCAQTGGLVERRLKSDRFLAIWGGSRLADPAESGDIVQAAAAPAPVGAARLTVTIVWEGVAVALGLFGAMMRTTWSWLNPDELRGGLGPSLPSRAIVSGGLGLVVGAASAALIQPYGGAISFLLGYFAPTLFEWLDRLFRPASPEARDWSKRQLTQISRSTHFIVGAGLAVIYLFGCALLGGNLPPSFASGIKPSESVGLLPFLVIIGGALGAWWTVTLDVTRGGGARPSGPPLLRYLLGAFAGLVAAYGLPSVLVAQGSSITAFNPFVLAFLSVAAGYAAARATRAIFGRALDSLEPASSAMAVEEGVRRALAPPALVNYKGYIVCVARHSDLVPMEMTEKGAMLRDAKTCLLDVSLQPIASELGLSRRIEIDDGIDADEAPFEIEVSAEGFNPGRRRFRILARGAAPSKEERLAFAVVGGGTARSFKVTASQGGRIVQFATMDVAAADAPKAHSSDEVQPARPEVEDGA
jgi:hypothetical protein